MPRINPFRSDKNSSSSEPFQDKQEQNKSFLQKLFFPKNQSSEPQLSEALIEQVSPIWETSIAPILIKNFGIGSTLYAIFYAANPRKKNVILEIWDPNYVDAKPSQIFKLKNVHNIARKLPDNRSKAQILTLKNWD